MDQAEMKRNIQNSAAGEETTEDKDEKLDQPTSPPKQIHNKLVEENNKLDDAYAEIKALKIMLAEERGKLKDANQIAKQLQLQLKAEQAKLQNSSQNEIQLTTELESATADINRFQNCLTEDEQHNMDAITETEELRGKLNKGN